MLFFGHLGITLGVAAAADFFTSRTTGYGFLSNGVNPERETHKQIENDRRRDSLRGIFDLRFWALGSLLPDIIDKPFGRYIFQGTFHYNGRIFSHTLLLVILLLVAALFLPRNSRGRLPLMAISGGVLMHLILDSMWLTPRTLFWPLLGWSFPSSSESDWTGDLLRGLLHNPAIFVPELIGAAALGILAVWLLRKKGIKQLIKSGHVG
jgi:inner membrane protein